MKQHLYHTIFLFTALILLNSCNSIDDCFHGTGDESIEDRSPGSFTGIYLTSNIHLNIHISNQQRVQVTAGENLQKGIEVKTENGILRLDNNNKCNWVRSFKPRITVDVWTPTLSTLFMEDATGDVNFADTLKEQNFRFDGYSSMGTVNLLLDCFIATIATHNGPLDVNARGNASVQYHYNAGFGVINCNELRSDNIYINNKGSNDSKINCENILEVTIEKTGNIYYRGNPSTIKTNITGDGKLIKL